MPTSAKYGFRSPAGTDPPNGPTAVQNLADDVDAEMAKHLAIESQHYAVAGQINVASGDTDFLPPFFIGVKTPQVKTLTGIRSRINFGTSVTFKIQKNGVDLGGSYSGLSATTADTNNVTGGTATFAHGDRINIVVTAVTGTPYNLSVTLFFETA